MTAVWYSAAPLFARRGARRAYPAGKERRIFRGEALRAFPLIFLRPPVLSDCGGLSRKGRAAVRCGSRQTPVPAALPVESVPVTVPGGTIFCGIRRIG